MPQVERSIVVQVPVERVFAFVADYRNTMRYQRHFSQFQPIGTVAHGLGMTVAAVGQFKGFPVRTRLRIVEFVENEKIVSQSVEGLKSAASWRFMPDGTGTQVNFTATFDFPVPILSRKLRSMVVSELETMTAESLRELKRLVESGV